MIVERVLHSIEHIEEGIEAADQFVNHSGIIDQLAMHFNSNSDNDIDVEGLKNNINKALKNCKNLTLRATGIKKDWDRKYPKPENCGKVKTGTSGLHLIRSRETLTSIAVKYHTTVPRLKEFNNLFSDQIRAGEYLKIPQN